MKSIFLFSYFLIFLFSATGQRVVEVPASLTYSPGAVIRHPVANALELKVTPEAGLSADGALRLVAQLRNSATDTATPLASTEVVPSGAGPYTLSFSAAQLNQTLSAGAAQRDVWLVVFKQQASDSGLEVWWTGSLRLTAHGGSLTAATAPAVTAILTLNAAGKAPLDKLPLLDATAHAADQVDSRIAGLTASDSTKLIFSTANHATGTYVRSATCWAAGIDLTGLGVARQTSGTWSTTLGFAAIAPTRVILCHHSIIPDGSTLRFVTAGNVVVDRTLSSSTRIGSTDIRVGTLSAALPDIIKPLALLPADFESVAGPDGLLLLTTDQQLKANVHEVSSWGNIGQPEAAKALEFYEAAVSGDSGHAWLVIREGVPYLFSFFTGTSSGELLHRFAASLASAAPAATFPAWRGGPHWDAVNNKPAFGNAALLTASATPTNGQLPLVGAEGKLPLSVIPDNPDNGTMPVGQLEFELEVGSNQIAMGNLGNGINLTGILDAADLIAGDDSLTYDGENYTWNGTFWEDGNFDLADPLILSDTTLTLSTNAARTITLLVPSYNSANTGAADVRVIDLPLFPVSGAVASTTRSNMGLTAWATKSYPADGAGVLTNNGSGGLSWGSGFNAAAPGNIGGTTPGTGAFTNLTASGTLGVTGATTLNNTSWGNGATFSYGDATASGNHRTALGLGTGASPTFTALTVSSAGGPGLLSISPSGYLQGSRVGELMFSTYPGQFMIPTDGFFGWATNTSGNSSNLTLWRDAANTLAQRNGTSPQESRLYGTYTSSTNFERLTTRYSPANSRYELFTEKGSGGGTARPLALGTDGTARWTIGATDGTLAGAGNQITATTAGVLTLGSGNQTMTISRFGLDMAGNDISRANNIRLTPSGASASAVNSARIDSPAVSEVEVRTAADDGFASVQSLYQRWGSGSPEGVVTAPIGATYHRTNGGAGSSFYVKESGSGNTGWVAK